MKKDQEKIEVLAKIKLLLETKTLVYNTKKKEFKSLYKKYKQLVNVEKKLASIFEQTYGKGKLQEYKKMFEADKLKNKLFALYFQTKVLADQVKDLKEFFEDDYYSSMKHIARAIINNSKTYNYFNYKEKLVDELELVVRGVSNEKVSKSFFDSYNGGKSKIDTFSL